MYRVSGLSWTVSGTVFVVLSLLDVPKTRTTLPWARGCLRKVLGLVTMSWAVLHDVSCLRVVLDCLGTVLVVPREHL